MEKTKVNAQNPGKQIGKPQFYRPILDAVSKSTVDVTSLVVYMTNRTIDDKDAFRINCAVIALEIKIAFNSAGWNQILSSLVRLNVPEYLVRITMSYFSERTLWNDRGKGMESENVNSGVNQESKLGPLLCNTMYGGILRVNITKESTIVGFAEDVAIVVQASVLEDVQIYANEAIRAICLWLESVHLALEI